MMFYYKDITQVCTAFLRMINAVSMCGMTAAVALRVLRKLCRIRHKGISVLKGVCVLCFLAGFHVWGSNFCAEGFSDQGYAICYGHGISRGHHVFNY